MDTSGQEYARRKNAPGREYSSAENDPRSGAPGPPQSVATRLLASSCPGALGTPCPEHGEEVSGGVGGWVGVSGGGVVCAGPQPGGNPTVA